jgi:hypothetical protein
LNCRWREAPVWWFVFIRPLSLNEISIFNLMLSCYKLFILEKPQF